MIVNVTPVSSAALRSALTSAPGQMPSLRACLLQVRDGSIAGRQVAVKGAAPAGTRQVSDEGVLDILPNERVMVPTGHRFESAPGYQIYSVAAVDKIWEHGFSGVPLAAAAGDEVCVMLINASDRTLSVRHGEEIGAIMAMPQVTVAFRERAALPETALDAVVEMA